MQRRKRLVPIYHDADPDKDIPIDDVDDVETESESDQKLDKPLTSSAFHEPSAKSVQNSAHFLSSSQLSSQTIPHALLLLPIILGVLGTSFQSIAAVGSIASAVNDAAKQERDYLFQTNQQKNDFRFQKRLAHNLARRDQTLTRKMHLIQLYTDMEQEYVSLRNELYGAKNEAVRDMFDSSNQKLQTILLASSIMFASISTVLVQGQLPDPSLVHMAVIWTMTIVGSGSFVCLFLAILFCIDGLNRVTDELTAMTHWQNKQIANVIDTKRESDILQKIISCNTYVELQAYWDKHAKDMDARILDIDKRLKECQRGEYGDDIKNQVEISTKRSLYSFAVGTILMLMATATYVFSNFSEKYASSIVNGHSYNGADNAEGYFNAGWLSVLIIGLGIFVGIFVFLILLVFKNRMGWLGFKETNSSYVFHSTRSLNHYNDNTTNTNTNTNTNSKISSDNDNDKSYCITPTSTRASTNTNTTSMKGSSSFAPDDIYSSNKTRTLYYAIQGNLSSKFIIDLFNSYTIEEQKDILQDTGNKERNTLLQYAVKYENIEAVQGLISKLHQLSLSLSLSPSPSSLLTMMINSRNEEGKTCLHLACEIACGSTFAVTNSNKMIKILLDNGADWSMVDTDHNTALHIAARQGNIRTIELIDDKIDMKQWQELKGGGFVNNVGDTPFMLACKSGNHNIVTFFMKKYAKIS